MLFPAALRLCIYRRIVEAFDSPYVEPGLFQNDRLQISLFYILVVDVGYLVLPSIRLRLVYHLVEHRIVEDIQPDDREIRTRFRRFFVDSGHIPFLVHARDAKAPRIFDLLEEYLRAAFKSPHMGPDIVLDDIVAEIEHAVVIIDIIFRDIEPVGNAVGLVLNAVDDLYLFAVRAGEILSGTEKFYEPFDMVRRRYDHYLVDTGLDQLFDGVINDRSVIERQ